MSIFEQISRFNATLTSKVIKEFLDYCEENEKTTISEIKDDFVDLMNSFMTNDVPKFDLKKTVKYDITYVKTKNTTDVASSTRIEGGCKQKFSTGKNKGLYCNKKCVEGTKKCKRHGEHPEKEHIQCSSKKADGKSPCAANATKEFEGKKYCTIHFKKVSGVPATPKKNSKKSKKVEQDPDTDIEEEEETKTVKYDSDSDSEEIKKMMKKVSGGGKKKISKSAPVKSDSDDEGVIDTSDDISSDYEVKKHKKAEKSGRKQASISKKTKKSKDDDETDEE